MGGVGPGPRRGVGERGGGMTDARLTAIETLCNGEEPWEVDGMAVPDLVAEVRRLQKENDRLRHQLSKVTEHWIGAEGALHLARATRIADAEKKEEGD